MYCLALELCYNLTSPHLCQACPDGLIACPSTEECVLNVKQCCSNASYYCQILDTCLASGRLCKLPNIAPLVDVSLIYIDTIESYGMSLSHYRGHMIGRILGNGILGNGNVSVDEQSEEVSIIVTEVSLGYWQYSICEAAFDICQTCSHSPISWESITNVSETNALYLPNTACLRFWRQSVQLEGAVWLRAKLWDGNTDGYISNSTSLVRYQSPFYSNAINYTDTGAISQNNTIITSLLLPVTQGPSVEFNTQQLLLQEDVSLTDNLGNSIGSIISVTTDYLPQLPVSFITGLYEPTHEVLLPSDVREQYYNQVTLANTIRQERYSAVNKGQTSGVAISLIHLDTDWQISFNGDTQLFVFLRDVLTSLDQVLLLNTSVLIRFLPSKDYSGDALLRVSGWDGVFPLTIAPVTILESNVFITSLTSLGQYHISSPEIITLTVQAIPDPPLVTQPLLLLSPSPYTLTYTHHNIVTVLIELNIASLHSDRERLHDILYLVLEQPVTITRLYTAPGNR